MNRQIIVFLFTFLGTSAFAQMDFQDSSAQVVTYWNLGDKYSYTVQVQTTTSMESDTLENRIIEYDLDLTVIDSTANSYIVDWHYKNFKTNSSDLIDQKISSIADDLSIKIQIDNMGVIIGVTNWEEVRDFMTAAIDKLKAENELPIDKDILMQQKEALYSSKENIEADAIQDVNQYHNFNGGKYDLQEQVTGNALTPNLYFPDQPFDTDFSIVLESIDRENNHYVIRSIQRINSEQMTDSRYKYLEERMVKRGQKLIPRDEFQNLSNIVETISRIHNSGWVLETVQWTEIISDGITKMEVRKIRMK
jgi:hypothetical protein